MERIIECVPNFSEGKNRAVIDGIAAAIAGARTPDGKAVNLLDVDPGEAAGRTVYTFTGSPEAVVEAAYQGVRYAAQAIDMRLHHGTHPRQGACDVLPLIPVQGITLEECAQLARELAERIARTLGIPSYCYEAAALKPERRNLAVCRAGEYESLPRKMADPRLAPDFGPDRYDERVARSGAICIGARKFLIAVNFNLDTTSVPVAHEIACDVRERGRKTVDADGTVHWSGGPLKGCKALGWYIEEYGIAQVSMNITDMDATPLHTAYETVCRAAVARGVHVTGTEIVGLVPARALIDAGRHFIGEGTEKTLPARTDGQWMQEAVRCMGLDDLRPFDLRKKVLQAPTATQRDA